MVSNIVELETGRAAVQRTHVGELPAHRERGMAVLQGPASLITLRSLLDNTAPSPFESATYVHLAANKADFVYETSHKYEPLPFNNTSGSRKIPCSVLEALLWKEKLPRSTSRGARMRGPSTAGGRVIGLGELS